MADFEHYENAVAKYHKEIRIKTTPVSSWDFNHDRIKEIRNSFSDFNSLEQIASIYKWKKWNWDVKNKLCDEVIIVTDVHLSIVFASQNITKMNGYKPEEVMGKSPRIFQGKKTSAVVSKQIKKAVDLEHPFEKTVLNYKKNGETYLCLIKGFPIYNKYDKLSHFIAFEKGA